MSNTRPYEDEVLASPREHLRAAVSSLATDNPAAILEVLEACACEFSGIALSDFRDTFQDSYMLSESQALEASRGVVKGIADSPVHYSLALSALAKPELSTMDKRRTGSYYTDFRLANFVARRAAHKLSGKNCRIIDPACGSGILLVAAALVAKQSSRRSIKQWIAENVFAADASEFALRAARLALASIAADIHCISSMYANWHCHDSLLETPKGHLGGFDVVVGNPPWEKVKLTRHEFLKGNGATRHYGADYHEDVEDAAFVLQRQNCSDYASVLSSRFSSLGNGELDLYKPFIELFVKLAADNGLISVLVPAGLIRSKGTEELRHLLFDKCSDISTAVIENRARFFGIDSRFKFVSLLASKSKPHESSASGFLTVEHAAGTPEGVEVNGEARVEKSAIKRTRKDLTIPEVRSKTEWRLFERLSNAGIDWDDPEFGWKAEIVREVDMTRDRKRFHLVPQGDSLPLIEGRMVHQFRCGAKAYVSGTGRRAKWSPLPSGQSEIAPQFWISEKSLSESVRQRVNRKRVGFCDVTGQTNERSMLTSLIPDGVVCGNKVPTIEFPEDRSQRRLYLWLAITNSFVFDWLLRRLVTTSVNFFLLRGVPLPKLLASSNDAKQLASHAKKLMSLDSAGKAEPWACATLRAEIDALVLRAYGGEVGDLSLILDDFPLLDRGQPSIAGEERSTITRDYALLIARKLFGMELCGLDERVAQARLSGAVAYCPSEFAKFRCEANEVANV